MLCVGAGITPSSASERGVSAQFQGKPVAVVSGIVTEFMHPNELRLDDALINDTAIWINLHQASANTMMQALAHASGGWWWHDRNHQQYHLQLNATPNDPHTLRVRSYASSLTHRYDLEKVVNALMQPWIEHRDHGMAHVPWTGQWTASTTSMGHAQLRSILALMEGSDTFVPTPLKVADQPQCHKSQQAAWDNPGMNWAEALVAMTHTWQHTLAISPAAADLLQHIRAPQRIDNLADVQEYLQDLGLHTGWISQVFCIDTAPVTHRHAPILRRHFAMIPIAHMSERYDGHLIANALQRSTASINWQLHGRACLFIDNPPRLLIAIEAEKINRVLDHLDHLEETGSLQLGQ